MHAAIAQSEQPCPPSISLAAYPCLALAGAGDLWRSPLMSHAEPAITSFPAATLATCAARRSALVGSQAGHITSPARAPDSPARVDLRPAFACYCGCVPTASAVACVVRIGRPGYRVTKQFDGQTQQRSLLFQVRSCTLQPCLSGVVSVESGSIQFTGQTQQRLLPFQVSSSAQRLGFDCPAGM